MQSGIGVWGSQSGVHLAPVLFQPPSAGEEAEAPFPIMGQGGPMQNGIFLTLGWEDVILFCSQFTYILNIRQTTVKWTLSSSLLSRVSTLVHLSRAQSSAVEAPAALPWGHETQNRPQPCLWANNGPTQRVEMSREHSGVQRDVSVCTRVRVQPHRWHVFGAPVGTKKAGTVP